MPTWLGDAYSQGKRTFNYAADGLKKYADLCEGCGTLAQDYRYPTGKGLLLAAQALWRSGDVEFSDPLAGNPCVLLPVYTRLSDAEVAERLRFAKQADTQMSPDKVEAPHVRQGRSSRVWCSGNRNLYRSSRHATPAMNPATSTALEEKVPSEWRSRRFCHSLPTFRCGMGSRCSGA